MVGKNAEVDLRSNDCKRAAVGIMAAIIFSMPTTPDEGGYDTEEAVQLAIQLMENVTDELGHFNGR